MINMEDIQGYIYVLQLKEDKYYVGKTNNLGRRFMEHMRGEGSKWTQLYKPISIINTYENKHELDEEMYTLEWMDKKGVDMVRGSCFSSLTLTDEVTKFIQMKIASMKQKCYRCNKLGHLVENCPIAENDSSITVLTINDLKKTKKKKWIIQNLLPCRSLICMYGNPGSGKTFITLDIGLHISHGIQWNDMKTKKGIVFYIVGEGINGIYSRIKAWHSYHNEEFTDTPFFIIEMCRYNITKREFYTNFIQMVRKKEIEYNCKTALIIIDTFAHALNGLDENDSSQVHKLFKELLFMNSELDSSTIFVHHSMKSKPSIKGSSAILATVDTSLQIKRTENKINIITDKQKDGDNITIECIIKSHDTSCIIDKE